MGIQGNYSATDGDYDPVLMEQFFEKKIVHEPETPDERIAWRLLARNICDCCFGERRKRLIYITEIRIWMDCKDAPYSFSWWCECLRLEESYVRRFLLSFLQRQERSAIRNRKLTRSEFSSLMKDIKVNRDSPTRVHLVHRLGEGLYGCSRCELIGDYSRFEDRLCEGTNARTDKLVHAGEQSEVFDAGDNADLPHGAATRGH